MRIEYFLKKGQYHLQKKHRIRCKLYKVFCKLYFQCDIPFEADIDETVYFCHNAFGVVINPHSKLEKNVVVQHGVTIGSMGGG